MYLCKDWEKAPESWTTYKQPIHFLLKDFKLSTSAPKKLKIQVCIFIHIYLKLVSSLLVSK